MFSTIKGILLVSYGAFAFISLANAGFNVGQDRVIFLVAFAIVSALASLIFCLKMRSAKKFSVATYVLMAILAGMYLGVGEYRLLIHGLVATRWSIEALRTEGEVYLSMVFINTFHYGLVFGWWLVLSQMSLKEVKENG